MDKSNQDQSQILSHFSSEENFHILLENILSPNNDLRKQSETNFNILLKGNPPYTVLLLGKMLLSSPKNSVKQLSCSLLNNLFNMTKSIECTSNWKALGQSATELQGIILKSFIAERTVLIKQNIADLIVSICENLFDGSDSTWPEIVALVLKAINTDINVITSNNDNEALVDLETTIYLLSKIYTIYFDELKSHIDLFISAFQSYYKSPHLSLKVKTSECVVEMLFILDKKNKKKAKVFMIDVLSTTLECFSKSPVEESNLKRSLLCVSELISSIPTVLSQNFSDLFILMGKITESTGIDNSIKEIAFDVITSLVEKKTKLFKQDNERLSVFLKSLVKYAFLMDDTIDETWLTPASESYQEEQIIMEEEVQGAFSYVSRLYDSIGFEKVMAEFSPIITELINANKNNNNSNLPIVWKSQYIGFTAISYLISKVSDMTSIENIISPIIENLSNSNPKVRYACLECVAELSDTLQPMFQNSYYTTILPKLTEMLNDSVLRIQLHACETLQAFVEHCHSEKILNDNNPYLKSLMETLLSLFLKDEIHLSLRESIINLFTEITTVVAEQIHQYAETLFNTMLKFLAKIYTDEKFKTVLNSTIEFITVLGPKCGNSYYQFVPDIAKVLIDIQNRIGKSIDPVFQSLKSAWNEIIPIIVEKNSEILPSIVVSVVKLIENTPKIYLERKTNNANTGISSLSTDSNAVSISEINFSELNKGSESNTNKDEDKKNIKTTETSDFAGSIELLNKILEKSSVSSYQYIIDIEKIVTPLLKFEFNSDIRNESSNCLHELAKIIAEKEKKENGLLSTNNNVDAKTINPQSPNFNNIVTKYKEYISHLFSALETEHEYEAISNTLDNIGSIIELLRNPFLSEDEMNEFCSRIIKTFEKVERFRLAIIEKSKLIEEEKAKEEQEKGFTEVKGNDSEDEDAEEEEIDDINRELDEEQTDIENILVAIADLFGSIFKSHKEKSLCLVTKLQSEILPKYFNNPNASLFEIKLGIFVLDDMVEFLGERIIPHLWGDVMKVLVLYSNHKEHDLRQAALHGVGEMVINSINYSLYNSTFLDCFTNAVKAFPKDEDNEEEWGYAHDNVTIGCGKVIETTINKNEGVELKSWVRLYVENSPVKYDEEDAQNKNEIFIRLVKNYSSVMLGSNNENLVDIVIAFLKMFKSKVLKEEFDKDIKSFVNNVCKDTQLSPAIEEIKNRIKQIKEKDLLSKLNEIISN